MNEPRTPEEADKLIDERKVRYRELYVRYQREEKEKCWCERQTCYRCRGLENLRREMSALA